MSQIEILRWQFDLTWRLAEHHLPALTDAACLWRPAPGAWTVRQEIGGAWRPDWSDQEPDPAPAVTIGWLTWHVIWWWSSVLSAAENKNVAPREEVLWPGGAFAAVARIQDLSRDWRGLIWRLTDDDIDRPIAYPWRKPRPLKEAIAWVNAELMKNVAEIGCVRHLYERSDSAP